MNIFNLIGYILGHRATQCSDIGLRSIDDVEICRFQVDFFRNSYPNLGAEVMIQTDGFSPRGCYIYTLQTANYGIYFNNHISGMRDGYSRPLCMSSKFSKRFYNNITICKF